LIAWIQLACVSHEPCPGAKTFLELKTWIASKLDKNQKQAVLLACGCGDGDAVTAADGGPAEFWPR
jgi:hypothetical protein